MRCLNNKKINENYKLELFDSSDIPLQTDILGEHCIHFSNFLYNLIERKYGKYLEE